MTDAKIDAKTDAPDPRLLQKALTDRDERPWHYYHFEREELIRGLDYRADIIAALRKEIAELKESLKNAAAERGPQSAGE